MATSCHRRLGHKRVRLLSVRTRPGPGWARVVGKAGCAGLAQRSPPPETSDANKVGPEPEVRWRPRLSSIDGDLGSARRAGYGHSWFWGCVTRQGPRRGARLAISVEVLCMNLRVAFVGGPADGRVRDYPSLASPVPRLWWPDPEEIGARRGLRVHRRCSGPGVRSMALPHRG
jgi:hypothetical protein